MVYFSPLLRIPGAARPPGVGCAPRATAARGGSGGRYRIREFTPIRHVMRFAQIDRITEIVDGQSLTAVKSVAMSEEYLQDHFPRFPVMPGVIMLESLFQASMWLCRVLDRFAVPVVALRQARNVRYKDMVEPGDQLLITTTLNSHNERTAEFSASGTVGGRPAVSARLTLERYWAHEQLGPHVANEPYILQEFRRKFVLLLNPGIELPEEVRQVLGLPDSVRTS